MVSIIVISYVTPSCYKAWILFRAMATLFFATQQPWFIQSLPRKVLILPEGFLGSQNFYVTSYRKDSRALRVNIGISSTTHTNKQTLSGTPPSGVWWWWWPPDPLKGSTRRIVIIIVTPQGSLLKSSLLWHRLPNLLRRQLFR